MRGLGDLIVRLLAVGVGLALAFPAAALFLVAGVHGGWFVDLYAQYEATAPHAERFAMATAVAASLVLAVKMAAAGALPALLAVAVAETGRLRGLVANLLLGGIVAAATGFLIHGEQAVPGQGAALAVLATGFVGGFVYWLIAGRGAGRWLAENNPKV